MLAELLLVLGGHPSSLLPPTGVAPELADHLHPGEVSALNTLTALAGQYASVQEWAERTQAEARAGVLDGVKKRRGGRGYGDGTGYGHDGHHGYGHDRNGHRHPSSASPHRSGQVPQPNRQPPGQYTAVLAGAIRGVLAEYDELVVRTEAAILARDPAYVQREPAGSAEAQSSAAGGLVPLSFLVATFDSWHAPMAALAALVKRVEGRREETGRARVGREEDTQDDEGLGAVDGREREAQSPYGGLTPGELMQYLADCAETGNPILSVVYKSLLDAVWTHFKTHLSIFVLFGVAADVSTPAAPALGLDAGADPPHRLYKLDEDQLPRSIGPATRASILYVGRVAATLKREGRALPRSLTERARADVMAAPFDGLEAAIQRTRAEVGEWLWTNVLTGEQVAEAIEAFANYFLTRDADYAYAVIREIQRLRLNRLVVANPTSSSSIIRAHDLDLALLRASIDTAAESDRALEAFSWSMPDGPLRPLPRAVHDDGTVRGLFSSALLGTPLALTAAVSWPLDLFMTAPAVAAYSDIHAYLYAIRDTHTRVLDCWSALSRTQRRRRLWTGANEGGTGDERSARTALARTAWGTVRAMLFFLDQLLSHFMTDIIGTQHKRLLDQLARAAPPLHASTLADVRPLRSSAPSVAGTPQRPLSSAGRHPPISVTTQLAPTPASAPPSATVATPSQRAATPTRRSTTPHRAHSLRTSTPHRPATPTQRAAAHLSHPPTPTSAVPPSPAAARGAQYLDFLTLRQMHAHHLAFLREGLLIADRETAVPVRDILDTCKKFAGMVERWGGDVLPELLSDGESLEERSSAVTELSETLHDQISDFFIMLLDIQTPNGADDSISASVSRMSRMSLSRARVSHMLQSSRVASGRSAAANASAFKPASKTTIGVDPSIDTDVMARHVEQLLLRLDFNGVLTAWSEGRRGGDVLPPGGLRRRSEAD